MLPPRVLGPLLTIVLNLLTIHSTSNDPSGTSTCPSKPILECLYEDQDVPSEVASGMMKLFAADSTAGATDDTRETKDDAEWKANVKAMVRVIGLGELECLKEGIPVDRFEYAWKEKVGDWGDLVDIASLAVSTLLSIVKASPQHAFPAARRAIGAFTIVHPDLLGPLTTNILAASC